MPHWKSMFKNNYLGAFSIDGDTVMTIDRIVLERVTGKDGRTEELPVCYFREASIPMVMNRTNMRTIAALTGKTDTDEWPGTRITLYVDRVSAFGDVTDALRVRPVLPASAAVRCGKCGREITGAHGMTGDELARYTKDKYGKALCDKCATEAAGNV